MRISQTLLAIAIATAASASLGAHHETKDHKAIAKGWVEASCTDRDQFAAYLEKHVADDAEFVRARYVGLGFRQDAEDTENYGTVTMVMDGTPASKVLKAGDRIVSVAGVPSTYENRDRTAFRGKPGEAVNAVVERDGKTMEVAITRGVITGSDSKDIIIGYVKDSNTDEWGLGSCTVTEQVGEGNVLYTIVEFEDVEVGTGYRFVGRNIVRLEFNDMGQVVKAWNQGEDRFVMEQLGYDMSR